MASDPSTPGEIEADVKRAMLLIKTLDNNASVLMSEWTGQWYVSANIELSDGVVLKGITEHRDTPDLAVLAFLSNLWNVPLDEVIVARPTGERRHFRWNGAAFAEQYDARLAKAQVGSTPQSEVSDG